MNDHDLREARRLLESSGDISEALLSDLVTVARTLVFGLALPPSVSPYGAWDEGVVDDLVADWLINRLLRRGELLSLLDKAYTPGAFRRMAERSLYNYIMSARQRSQSQNIWTRLGRLLDSDDRFVIVHQATTRSGRYYTLSQEPQPRLFDGADRELASAAHAAGPLEYARWSSPGRLSPLLNSDELTRFVFAVMRAIRAALTPVHLMAALGARVDLAPDNETVSESALATASAPVVDVIAVRAAAVAAYRVLNERERVGLLHAWEGMAGQDIARQLGRSAATVSSDRRRVAGVINELADDPDDRRRILAELITLLTEEADRNREIDKQQKF